MLPHSANALFVFTLAMFVLANCSSPQQQAIQRLNRLTVLQEENQEKMKALDRRRKNKEIGGHDYATRYMQLLEAHGLAKFGIKENRQAIIDAEWLRLMGIP
jgi:hypothetical protein